MCDIKIIDVFTKDDLLLMTKKIQRAKDSSKKQDWLTLLNSKDNLGDVKLSKLKKADLKMFTNVTFRKLKETARIDEDVRICRLVYEINMKTTLGSTLRNEYVKTFGKTIKEAKKAGTNRDHYDMVLIHTDGTEAKCEEKGTCSHKNITDEEVPWKNSVQCFNGPGNHFDIGKKWAKLWYDIIITQINWKEVFNVKSKIPSYDDWIKDAFRCGDPKTEFVKELKLKCRERFGEKSSLNGKSGGSDYREFVNSTFVINEEEKTKFIEQVSSVFTNILTEKECYLQTSGRVDAEFSFKWKKQISKPSIIDLEYRWNIGSDAKFDFKTDNNMNFSCILRFGKGCGFTNIRLDIR